MVRDASNVMKQRISIQIEEREKMTFNDILRENFVWSSMDFVAETMQQSSSVFHYSSWISA